MAGTPSPHSPFREPHLATAAQDERPPDLPPKLAGPPPAAAYVHLPFCHRKCRYCDFPVIAVGMSADSDQAQHNMQLYADILLREMRATAVLNSESGPLTSVFFGGGASSIEAWNLGTE